MNITLTPRSLVMTPDCCFYCGSTSEDEIFHTQISHLFGIKHCGKHEGDAKRDCNAYKHHNNLVCMLDAKDLPALGPLFSQPSFVVQRSSGLLEGGWTLNYGTSRYITKKGDDWYVPLQNGDFTKSVLLKSLIEAGDAIEFLNAGVYATDAAAAAAATPGYPSIDPPWIRPAMCEGVVCRVASCE